MSGAGSRFSALRNHRRSIQQKLSSGYDYLVARLDALLDFVIVAHSLPDLQRLLPRQVRSAILRLGDKGEVLTGQPRHGKNGDLGVLVRAPHDAGADELRLPQSVIAIGDAGF